MRLDIKIVGFDGINEASRIHKAIVGSESPLFEPIADRRREHFHELEARLILSSAGGSCCIRGHSTEPTWAGLALPHDDVQLGHVLMPPEVFRERVFGRRAIGSGRHEPSRMYV